MKLTIALFMAALSLLTGCTTSTMGPGTVFHTASGQHITAASPPIFTNDHYEFVDAEGRQQSLYPPQIISISKQ